MFTPSSASPSSKRPRIESAELDRPISSTQSMMTHPETASESNTNKANGDRSTSHSDQGRRSSNLQNRATDENVSLSPSISDTVFAFESALRAEMTAGHTLGQAVRNLLDSLDDQLTTSRSRRQRKINLSAPIIAALNTTPQLSSDVNTVAQMCQVVYELHEEQSLVLKRPRLPLRLSSLEDVATLIKRAKSIVVLTGAGVSVSCGIPDFRSKGGVYDAIRAQYELPEPEAIFDLHEFHNDPSLFFSFAKHVMPSPSLKPSPTHAFVAELSKRGKLLRNYSQNIDGLESRAGVPSDRLVLCHGSFLSATCISKKCAASVPGSAIVHDVLAGLVPQCVACKARQDKIRAKRRKVKRSYEIVDDDGGDGTPDIGIMKPDIVFFGESLPSSVSEYLQQDINEADLVLVLGTSLKVNPVARIPCYFQNSVPRILINREFVPYDFDVELMGYCDVIVQQLRVALGWDDGSSGLERNDLDTIHIQQNTSVTSNKDVPLKRTQMAKLYKAEEWSNDYVKFIPPRQFLFKGAAQSVIRMLECLGRKNDLFGMGIDSIANKTDFDV